MSSSSSLSKFDAQRYDLTKRPVLNVSTVDLSETSSLEAEREKTFREQLNDYTSSILGNLPHLSINSEHFMTNHGDSQQSLFIKKSLSYQSTTPATRKINTTLPVRRQAIYDKLPGTHLRLSESKLDVDIPKCSLNPFSRICSNDSTFEDAIAQLLEEEIKGTKGLRVYLQQTRNSFVDIGKGTIVIRDTAA